MTYYHCHEKKTYKSRKIKLLSQKTAKLTDWLILGRIFKSKKIKICLITIYNIIDLKNY